MYNILQQLFPNTLPRSWTFSCSAAFRLKSDVDSEGTEFHRTVETRRRILRENLSWRSNPFSGRRPLSKSSVFLARIRSNKKLKKLNIIFFAEFHRSAYRTRTDLCLGAARLQKWMIVNIFNFSLLVRTLLMLGNSSVAKRGSTTL
jgi:hypothetical protein